MKKDLKQLERRMNDFYYEAITPEGETVILSHLSVNPVSNPSIKQRVKPLI